MTATRPPSPLDSAFFALVTRGWNAHSLCIRAAILFTIVVFALLPLLYFWTLEKAA